MAPRGAAQARHRADPLGDIALSANLATYEDLDERRYVDGAPHLKHISIGGIYRSLIVDAIRSVGREPADISVLDVGAGNGLAGIPWFRRKVRLTAVDSSESMLNALRERAAIYESSPRIIVSDALDYLNTTPEKFDIVTHVSMLHHVPDYAELLRASASRTRVGGALLTFQDPLRYDAMPRWHHTADRAAYFAWRLGQGNYKRGLKTRWRRLRGVYSETETVDFDEYHVVRNGVDSDEIVDLLRERFTNVKTVAYWSTYSPLLQAAGERLGLTSSFGVLATGRKPVPQE
jgi:2-polyprenyl-3-methyl-5-hydroxy-6-metoxy-1,4-benzoquinol methylase